MSERGKAFAAWSPCVYAGAITCADCARYKSTDPDERCDMAAGRTMMQAAYEAGWTQRGKPNAEAHASARREAEGR